MINDFITRLTNLAGEYFPETDRVSDIYRPPFTPSTEPDNTVVTIRNILFGDCILDSDTQTRALLLTRIVDSTELKEYLTKYDTRITYNDEGSLDKYSPLSSGLSIKGIEDLSDTNLYKVLQNKELVRQYNLNTFFDRVAAITVGLVEYQRTQESK